jgi:hypothetical protein
MSSIAQTYSFKDLVGALTNTVFRVSFPLTGGNIGIGSMTISMGTERTTHDVAADGVVMPSYIAGDNGEISIEAQQTSPIHHALLDLYNLCVTAANNDDVSGWASTGIAFRTLLDGSTHVATGVSFGKIPDKPYQAQGQRVTWRLLAANIINQ